METEMVPASAPASSSEGRGSVQQVRDAIRSLGSPGTWAKSAGRHVLVGRFDDEAFARLTPLPAGVYGLSFRSPQQGASWAPMLLVDELAEVVAHALIGAEAVAI
jgi:hypothetical protein